MLRSGEAAGWPSRNTSGAVPLEYSNCAGLELSWVRMTQFETVLRKVESYRPGDDLAVLRNAYRLCLEKHEGQKRLSGEPYISHPLEVTSILAELRLDTVCLAAGMLHDVIVREPHLARSPRLRPLAELLVEAHELVEHAAVDERHRGRWVSVK